MINNSTIILFFCGLFSVLIINKLYKYTNGDFNVHKFVLEAPKEEIINVKFLIYSLILFLTFIIVI